MVVSEHEKMSEAEHATHPVQRNVRRPEGGRGALPGVPGGVEKLAADSNLSKFVSGAGQTAGPCTFKSWGMYITNNKASAMMLQNTVMPSNARGESRGHTDNRCWIFPEFAFVLC